VAILEDAHIAREFIVHATAQAASLCCLIAHHISLFCKGA
jgi:hypothetical protein